MSDHVDIAAQLVALNAQYRLKLEEHLRELERMVTDQDAQIGRTRLSELRAALHSLAGSGGTFGFDQLSALARALELKVNDWVLQGRVITPSHWDAWKADLLRLKETIAAKPPAQTTDVTADPQRT